MGLETGWRGAGKISWNLPPLLPPPGSNPEPCPLPDTDLEPPSRHRPGTSLPPPSSTGPQKCRRIHDSEDQILTFFPKRSVTTTRSSLWEWVVGQPARDDLADTGTIPRRHETSDNSE